MFLSCTFDVKLCSPINNNIIPRTPASYDLTSNHARVPSPSMTSLHQQIMDIFLQLCAPRGSSIQNLPNQQPSCAHAFHTRPVQPLPYSCLIPPRHLPTSTLLLHLPDSGPSELFRSMGRTKKEMSTRARLLFFIFRRCH